MCLYLKFLSIMCIVSFITTENIILLKRQKPQRLSQNYQNAVQQKIDEIQTNILMNSMKEKILLRTIKKRMAIDSLMDELRKKLFRKKDSTRSKYSSYEESSHESNSDDSGEGEFRDLTRLIINKKNQPRPFRRGSSSRHREEYENRHENVHEAKPDHDIREDSDLNEKKIQINVKDLLRTAKSRVNSNTYVPNSLSYASTNGNNRIVYRKFGTKKAAKTANRIYSEPLKAALKKLNLSESDTSDSSQSEDVNKLNEDDILPKGRPDRVPKRFEVVKNNRHKKKNPYVQYSSSSSEKSTEEVIITTTTSAPKHRKKKHKKIEPEPEEQPLSDTELPQPKKKEKKEVYIQGPGRIIKTGPKSSSSHSDENFRRDVSLNEDNILDEIFPGVEEDDLKQHIEEIMRSTDNDKKTKRKGKKKKKVRSRKRMPYFLPKRIHWNREDFKNLGYFWFNGPQGKYPGIYRIGY